MNSPTTALQPRQPADMWTHAKARVLRDCRQRVNARRLVRRLAATAGAPALLRVQAE